jgi:hypothetical protein
MNERAVSYINVSFLSCDYKQSLHVEYSTQYIGRGLLLTICACHSWAMALNLSLSKSVDSMQDWKGIRTKAEQVSNMKFDITNDGR